MNAIWARAPFSGLPQRCTSLSSMMRARRSQHLITIAMVTTCYWYAVTYALTPTPQLTSAEWESRLCQGYGAINAAFGDNWGSAEWASDFSKLAVMVYYPTIGAGPPGSPPCQYDLRRPPLGN